MRIPNATWLSGAAVVFAAGLLTNSADLILASALAASAGLAALAVSGLRSHRQSPQPDVVQVQYLEQRLLAVEGALAAATQELAGLKQDRALDAPLDRGRESSAP